MPTVKQTGVVLVALIILMFVPFYIVSLIISDAGALIVQVFTSFPLTAPVAETLRNGYGNLKPLVAAFVITGQFELGVLVVRVAVNCSATGSIAYTDKLNPRTILRRRRPVTAGR